MIEYQLIRSRRRTISLQIGEDARLVVRAPLRASKRLIEGFIEQKQDWILACQSRAAHKLRQREAFAITGESRLLLLGEEHPVALLEGALPAFDGERFILPQGEQGETKRAAAGLYRSLAQQILPRRVEAFALATGLAPSAVRISGAAKRWGSCSGKNSLNFSWRLILAPLPAVDYVVVHELAHIRHHNHSTEFWKLVENILPDYRAREALLEPLERRLQTEDWGEKRL